MAIRTIAVAVTSAREAEWLIAAATELATTFEAHLTIVHPVQPMVLYSGVVFDPVLVPDFLDWQVEQRKAIHATFDRVTAAAGIVSELRSQESVNVGADHFLLEAVRAADLVVAGRLDRVEGGPEASRVKEMAIRHCGRPVLIVPPSRHLTGPAGHLLIGWSPTREATRAAHDALALAAPGARVDLLVAGHDTAELEFDARQDLAAALDRRGFRTELVDRRAAAGDAGEVLLQTAFERGADLVATGAFGHSRLYDFVIGAVTSHLARKAEIPVLLSK